MANENDIDLDEIRGIYRRERDRRIRPDGTRQYARTPGYYNGEGTADITGRTYSPGPVAFRGLPVRAAQDPCTANASLTRLSPECIHRLRSACAWRWASG